MDKTPKAYSAQEFAATFLSIYKVKLETVSEDYVPALSGVQVLENDILEHILNNLNEGLKDKIPKNQIRTFIQQRLGLGPIKESAQKADQFEILSCYNEGG